MFGRLLYYTQKQVILTRIITARSIVQYSITIFVPTARISSAFTSVRKSYPVTIIRSYVSVVREIPETKNVVIRYHI